MKMKFNVAKVNVANESKGIDFNLEGLEVEVEVSPAEAIEGGKQLLELVGMFKDSLNRDLNAHTDAFIESTKVTE